jgi:hypothetical protein
LSPPPCPKCGSTDIWIVEHAYVGDTGVYHHEYYAECGDCKFHSEGTATVKQAIEIWEEMVR